MSAAYIKDRGKITDRATPLDWRIHRVPLPGTGARLFKSTGMREDVLFMDGTVRDPVIVVKNVLRAVSVMIVPVNDCDAINKGERLCRRNRRVV